MQKSRLTIRENKIQGVKIGLGTNHVVYNDCKITKPIAWKQCSIFYNCD